MYIIKRSFLYGYKANPRSGNYSGWVDNPLNAWGFTDPEEALKEARKTGSIVTRRITEVPWLRGGGCPECGCRCQA